MGIFYSYCMNCHNRIMWFLDEPLKCRSCGKPTPKEDLWKTFFRPWEVYSMKSNFELVKEFHAAFNKSPDPAEPTDQPSDVRFLRTNLIFEEFREAAEELGYKLSAYTGGAPSHIHLDDQHEYVSFQEVNLEKLAKELADLLYVVYGTAAAYGLPIDEVYREVHRSNMSKLGEDGKPIYREDGKVLKGPKYSTADIRAVLNRFK